MSSWRAWTTGLAVPALAGLTALTGVVAPATAAVAAGGGSWHASVLATVSKKTVAEAVSPGSDDLYTLASRSRDGNGPFRLDRFGLKTRAAATGPAFPASQLSLAGGFLWVSGPVSTSHRFLRAVLYQVNPATLAVIRSWTLSRTFTESVTVAAGPGRTVWTGYGRTLRLLSTTTGATLMSRRVGAGLQVADVATDPGLRFLYASLNSTRRDGSGSGLREFSARTGRLLASNGGAPLKFAVGGAALTAVAGHVWASFRTGMAGQTVLLRQPGLSVVHVTGGRNLYAWFQDASTISGGGALWIANAGNRHGGRIGCVSPATAAVRSTAVLKALTGGGDLLAVRSAAHELIAAGPDGILAITTPARCWG